MNAAILLVSSAWMAGQTPDVIIPVGRTTSCGSPCTTSCNTRCSTSCCDSRPRLCDRIRGLFQRNGCESSCAPPRCPEVRCHEVRCHEVRCRESRCHETRCQTTCPTNNHCSQPRCHSFQWPQLNLCNRDRNCCNPCQERIHAAPCHNQCDNGCGHSHGELLARIRGAFHRDRGCNGGCNTNCCTTTVVPGAEPIREQPKKLPGKGELKKAQETRLITTPQQAPTTHITPVIAPTPALAPPVLASDPRNPF